MILAHYSTVFCSWGALLERWLNKLSHAQSSIFWKHRSLPSWPLNWMTSHCLLHPISKTVSLAPIMYSQNRKCFSSAQPNWIVQQYVSDCLRTPQEASGSRPGNLTPFSSGRGGPGCSSQACLTPVTLRLASLGLASHLSCRWWGPGGAAHMQHLLGWTSKKTWYLSSLRKKRMASITRWGKENERKRFN